MARITVEDCLAKISNHFQLAIVAGHRARLLQNGSEARIENDGHKVTVLALREIAAGEVDESILEEPLIDPMMDAKSDKGLVGMLAEDINMRPGMIAVTDAGIATPTSDEMKEGEATEVVVPEGAEGAEGAGVDSEALGDDKVAEEEILVGDTVLETDTEEEGRETISLESLQSAEAVDDPIEGSSDEITAQVETSEKMEKIADLNLNPIEQDDEENKSE